MDFYQNVNFNELEPGELTDYIVSKHHQYYRELFQLMHSQFQLLFKEDENQPLEIHTIYNEFLALMDNMNAHMRKEEHILFPYIKSLNDIKEGSEGSPGFKISLLDSPIKMIEKDHDDYCTVLSKIRKLTNNFTPVENSTPTMKLCFAEFQDFEQDLHQYVYLENNILFPKLRKLEQMCNSPECQGNTNPKNKSN